MAMTNLLLAKSIALHSTHLLIHGMCAWCGHLHTHTHAHMYARTHARTHTCTHARTHTHMYARTHAHTHTCRILHTKQARFFLTPLFADDVFHGMKRLVRNSSWRVSHHGRRLALNVMFLSLLVLHRNAALKEYAAVTELSPGRLFHLLVLSAGAVERRNLHQVRRHHSVANITDYSSQWELITITKRRTFLLGDGNRLRSPYLQHCTVHSSVNFIAIHLDRKGHFHPCAREAAKNKNDLQFFWNTAVHDKILTATVSAERKH